jgi:hypothetical protein
MNGTHHRGTDEYSYRQQHSPFQAAKNPLTSIYFYGALIELTNFRLSLICYSDNDDFQEQYLYYGAKYNLTPGVQKSNERKWQRSLKSQLRKLCEKQKPAHKNEIGGKIGGDPTTQALPL